MSAQSFPAGHIIYEKGDLSVCAYLIQSGKVELLRGYPAKTVRIALLKSGDIFGEMGLVEERPRSLTARAVGSVSLSTMTRIEFEHMLTNDPQQCLQYVRMLFERLRAMNARVQEHTEEVPAGHYRVILFPESSLTVEQVPANGLVIGALPFRIGRAPEEKEKAGPNVNNLDLRDKSPYTLSREHVSIEEERGKIVVRDRGSKRGTTVNDEMIGGQHKEGEALLKEGENSLILGGGRHSRYRFRVVVTPDAAD
jgi:hypothetical protein